MEVNKTVIEEFVINKTDVENILLEHLERLKHTTNGNIDIVWNFKDNGNELEFSNITIKMVIQ